MQSSMRLPFALLCTVPFIMVLGNSMLVPLLPKMKEVMSVSLFQVSLFITAFSLPAGITIPFAGFLSDRFGRKIIMAPALILYGTGGLLAGTAALLTARPYYLILGSRILQGIGAGGTYQLAMALVGDIFQSNERAKALGLLEASNGLGKVISPIAGALLGLIAWFAPFFAYGFLAIPIGLAIWLIVREPKQGIGQHRTIESYFGSLKQIFKEKGAGLLACFLAGMTVLFLLFGILSLVADNLEAKGWEGLQIGLLLALPVGSMALTSYLCGSYLQKKNAQILKITLVTGLSVVTGALLLMAFKLPLYLFLIVLIFLGVGTGSVLPAVNTLITSAASASQRGGITCLYGSMRFLGVALGPPVFGLAARGGLFLWVLAAALTFVIALLTAFLVHVREMLPPDLLTQP
ncbi:MFS transporter, ACDE family, multidrug resistance protein [Thermanaeromonas toyohensis ToBE]|uniref:MFS transporter, ACDE family, multidrug resistance protein n=2 Tax=Thermanaeromonas TaxID=202949 RepID=A0A1W1W348_9FIRM|nr:MFS transporter, ACDE family, multidrug resistance protein [Thermanaeromonas toyohensis ToBE]